MSILDVLAGVVAGPASRFVEAPVRDIVDEVLRKHDLARPEDVAALRGEVTRLTQELASMQTRLGDLLGNLEGLQSETASLRSALANAQASSTPAAASAPLAVEDLPAAEEAPASEGPPSPKKRGRKSLAHLGCGIEGCKDEHRSKGFCAKHYQSWRRGNLEGYIGPEGLIGHDGGAWQVDQKHAGKAAAVDSSGKRAKVLVEGKSVRAKKIA